MRTLIMLRSTREKVVNDYESKLKIKNQDINNLINENCL